MRAPIVTVADVFKAFVFLMVGVSAGLLVAVGFFGLDLQNIKRHPDTPDERFAASVKKWLRSTFVDPDAELVQFSSPIQDAYGSFRYAQVKAKNGLGIEVAKNYRVKLDSAGAMTETDEAGNGVWGSKKPVDPPAP